MDFFRQLKALAFGLLVLAGVVAVCPHGAHGSLSHDPVHEEEAHTGSQETEHHHHEDCEYETSHTHDMRVTCSPNELTSWIVAGYLHLRERISYEGWVAPPGTGGSDIPAARSQLSTIRLLL